MWPAIPQRYAGAHGRHTHREVFTMWEVHRVCRWRPCRACVGYRKRSSLSCLSRPQEARPLCRLLYLWTISGVRLCRRCVSCPSDVDTRAIKLAACLLLPPIPTFVCLVSLRKVHCSAYFAHLLCYCGMVCRDDQTMVCRHAAA